MPFQGEDAMKIGFRQDPFRQAAPHGRQAECVADIERQVPDAVGESQK
jgi:hypothetical protein